MTMTMKPKRWLDRIFVGLSFAFAGVAALPSEGHLAELGSATREWPVADELAAVGIRLRMPYRQARQRMIDHGWSPDTTEPAAKHGADRLPYREFPEVLCGEGYDAICSAWFKKDSQSHLLDVREVDGVLIVRGSR